MRTIHPNTRYGLLSVLENKKIIPATHIRNTSGFMIKAVTGIMAIMISGVGARACSLTLL